jgi:glycine/D-amino acid oxidase-like deaminating enzyme
MSTTPSFWLDQLGSRPSRPALAGDREADVCIVGGGFTGLWTAYALKRADPSLQVVVLESHQVGFGASGRNGGWVLGKISGSSEAWRARGGPEAPRAMVRAIQQTVEEIGAVVAAENIDCAWKHGGTVTVAQSDTQLERLREQAQSERDELGEDLAWEVLGADAMAARINVDGVRGGLYTPHCARVQPARLVAGLAAAVERHGVTIYESSRVKTIEPGLAMTRGGDVRARYVLRAIEGYTADMSGEHRSLLPMNSSMIVTEPLADAEWARLGWDGAETMLDGSHLYTYSQRTADGRIAIGGRGVPYRFGSRTDREGRVPTRTIEELRARLISLFPSLAGVRVERAWHGILGVSRDWCPTVALDAASGIGYAGGYAGEGVAASNLAARTLSDLVLGRDTDLTRLPWVGTAPRPWEPEPLRFIGARGIYTLYRIADRQERVSHRASPVATLANKVAGR